MHHRLFCLVPLAVCFVLAAGCGGPSATVKGRVTCSGKGVEGSILFSPVGEGNLAPGEATRVTLDADGKFNAVVKPTGKFNVLVSPKDLKLVKTGELAYPCDLSSFVREIKSGDNELIIELEAAKR